MSDVDGWQDWRVVANPLVTSDVDGLPEDDDGQPVGYANWYNSQFFGQTIDTSRDHACEMAWRNGAKAYAAQCRAKGAEDVEQQARELLAAEYVADAKPMEVVNAILYDKTLELSYFQARALRAIVAALRTPTKPAASVVDGWRQIEDAPKDGEWIIVGWDDGSVEKARWDGSGWADDEGQWHWPPTLYVPGLSLPEAALSQPATDQDIAEGKALDLAIDEHCEQKAGR